MKKIFASVYPFGKYEPACLKVLKTTGYELIQSPHKRKLSPLELVDYGRDADVLIAGTENLEPYIHSNSNLKFISRVGIGLDSVPLKLCREKGIRVSYTPDAVTMAVAEMTVGLILILLRKLQLADMEIRSGAWTRYVGKRIENINIGIVGFGRIGKALTRLLSSFRPKSILVYDIKDKTPEINQYQKQYSINLRALNLHDLYRESDIISLHVPLYHKTRDMIGIEELKMMKKDICLINTARGGIIRESDLLQYLKGNQEASAAIDVFTKEPYFGDLKELSNIFLSQHMGSCSIDCRINMELQAAEEAVRFILGQKLHSEVPDEEYEYQD